MSKENDWIATLREKIFQFLPPFLLDVPSSKVPSVDSISVHNMVQGKAHLLPNIPNPEKNEKLNMNKSLGMKMIKVYVYPAMVAGSRAVQGKASLSNAL